MATPQHQLQHAPAAAEQQQSQQQHDSDAEALRLFDELPLGQQNMLLDLATVFESLYDLELLLPVWRTWHGQQADQWLSKLRDRRLVDTIGLQTLQSIITSKPDSPHYGSRIWVSRDKLLMGGHEVSSWPMVRDCLPGCLAASQRPLLCWKSYRSISSSKQQRIMTDECLTTILSSCLKICPTFEELLLLGDVRQQHMITRYDVNVRYEYNKEMVMVLHKIQRRKNAVHCKALPRKNA
jgi:hypothetical protein